MVVRSSPPAVPEPDRLTAWAARGVVALAVLGLALVIPFRPPPEGPFGQWLEPSLRAAQVPAAYLFAVPLAGLLACAGLLCRTGGDRVPRLVFLAGVFLIAGGIGFDVLATAVHSPDLSQEMNPVARALLDSGRSPAFVAAYGATLQGGLALVYCLLWAAFLRHRRTPTTAALVLTWLLVPWALGDGVYRWYLGLVWFQLVPQLPSDDLAQIAAKGPMIVGFILWCLYNERSAGRRDRPEPGNRSVQGMPNGGSG